MRSAFRSSVVVFVDVVSALVECTRAGVARERLTFFVFVFRVSFKTRKLVQSEVLLSVAFFVFNQFVGKTRTTLKKIMNNLFTNPEDPNVARAHRGTVVEREDDVLPVVRYIYSFRRPRSFFLLRHDELLLLKRIIAFCSLCAADAMDV